MGSNDFKISQLATVTAGAAAAADLAPSAVDMAGYQGVIFVVAIGPMVAGAVASIKAQQSSDNGAADGWSDIAGSSQAVPVASADKTFYIDVVRPTKRYVRPFVARATQNATVGAITAIQYGARRRPVTHGANVSGERSTWAAEGTA
jgi:hypothetical protein